MTFRYEILEAAKVDLEDTYAYLAFECHHPDIMVAERLLVAAERTFEAIASAPFGYPVIEPPSGGRPLTTAIRKRTISDFQVTVQSRASASVPAVRFPAHDRAKFLTRTQ